jgi:hypothetical protein
MGQFRAFMNTNPVLSESSWSRIIQHIESDATFAVISAFTSANEDGKVTSKEENINNHSNLKKDVRALGYGYIEQDSGYTYETKEKEENGEGERTLVREKSLFIPEINFEKAIALGLKYKQESILFKDGKKFALIYCRDGIDRDGNPYKKYDVGMTFKMNVSRIEKDGETTSKGQLTFDPRVLKYAYSSLIRANKVQRYNKKDDTVDANDPEIKNRMQKKQFAYVAESVIVESIHEALIPSRAEAMRGNNYITWRDIITGERKH